MDRLRPTDIVVVQQNGAGWVDPLSGGASTHEHQFRYARAWWVIPNGTAFSDLLILRNDHGRHWLWEPAQGMPLADYVQLLTRLNAEFARV